MHAPSSIDRGYPATAWPKSADRAAYKALADASTVPDSRKDDLAKAMAMIGGPLKTPARAAVFDGEPISPTEAAKLRALGRSKLSLNFNRKAA